jgi:hypothetical protein
MGVWIERNSGIAHVEAKNDDETSSYTIYCDAIPEDKRQVFESLFMDYCGSSMTFKYEKALTMKLARSLDMNDGGRGSVALT